MCLFVCCNVSQVFTAIYIDMNEKKVREKEEVCHVATIVQYNIVHNGIILYFTLHHVVRLILTNLKSQPYWAKSGE